MNSGGTEERVLPAGHATNGFVITYFDYYIQQLRVREWSYLSDLLFWNPAQYFATHPNIESVWIDLEDPTDDTTTVSRASQVDPLPRALILRRSEVTYTFCDNYRRLQLEFFRNYDLALPNVQDFTSTLQGE